MLLQPTGSVLGWLHIKWAGPSAAWTGLCCKHQWDRLPQPLFVLSSGTLCICKCSCIFPCTFSWSDIPPTSPPHPDLQALSPCPRGLWWVCWQQCIPWASQWCCIVRMWYPLSLWWSFPGLGIGLKKPSDQSLGIWPLSKLPWWIRMVYNSTLTSYVRFLISKYQIPSGPGAVFFLLLTLARMLTV